ncbi:hypothetical protein CPB83DRAFT_356442 [Crepidotus variabilis]|uniref:F-box domain-containing protein n=1 Tax=Crepidotus variabilis TaxID=179855 RepID=A0A9P6EFP4_9AGAR|nr:hypothetical protein CPB83DRAFT_356442 [Crepidotus variabilis]
MASRHADHKSVLVHPEDCAANIQALRGRLPTSIDKANLSKRTSTVYHAASPNSNSDGWTSACTLPPSALHCLSLQLVEWVLVLLQMVIREIPLEIIHLILLHLDCEHDQGHEYLTYFQVSRAFWHVSRTFFFRTITIKPQLNHVYPYKSLLFLLQHAKYSICPLIRNVRLILDGFGRITDENLDKSFLRVVQLVAEAGQLDLLFLSNSYPWHNLPLPLRQCIELMMQAPILQSLKVNYAPNMPVELFKHLNITHLNLVACQIDSEFSESCQKFSLPAMPLTELSTDHTFPLLSLYCEDGLSTSEDNYPLEAFAGLTRYTAHSKNPFQDFIFAQRCL